MSSGWPTERTLNITIDREEGLACVCRIVYQSEGDENLSAMIGNPVVVDMSVTDSQTGVVSSGVWFTGTITTHPSYDSASNTVTLTCTDKLRQIADGMTNDDIDLLIPDAVWSESLQGEKKEGWDYIQQLLQTSPGVVDLSPSGFIRYTPLAVTADALTFASDVVHQGTYSVSGGNSSPVNLFELNVDYRYTARRERLKRWLLDSADPCDFLQSGKKALTYDMLSDAIRQFGWRLMALGSTVMGSGSYTCTGGSVNFSSRYVKYVLEASFILAKRHAQSVTEKILITYRNDESIAAYGENKQSITVAVDIESDNQEWLNEHESLSAESIQPEAESDIITSVRGSIIPGTEGGNMPPSHGIFTSSIGDTVDAQGDDAQVQAAIDAGALYCQTQMLRTHRTGRVSFQTIANPNIDTIYRGSVTCPNGTATGKIGRVSKNIVFGETPQMTQTVTLFQVLNFTGTMQDPQAYEPPHEDDYATCPGGGTVTMQRLEDQTTEPATDFNGLHYQGDATSRDTPMRFVISDEGQNSECTDNAELERTELAQTLTAGATNDTGIAGVA